MSNLTDALIAAKLVGGSGGSGGGSGSTDNVFVAHLNYNETTGDDVLDKSYAEFAEAWEGGKAILIASRDNGVGYVTEWNPVTLSMKFIFTTIGSLGGSQMGLVVDCYELKSDNTLAYDNTYDFLAR